MIGSGPRSAELEDAPTFAQARPSAPTGSPTLGRGGALTLGDWLDRLAAGAEDVQADEPRSLRADLPEAFKPEEPEPWPQGEPKAEIVEPELDWIGSPPLDTATRAELAEVGLHLLRLAERSERWRRQISATLYRLEAAIEVERRSRLGDLAAQTRALAGLDDAWRLARRQDAAALARVVADLAALDRPRTQSEDVPREGRRAMNDAEPPSPPMPIMSPAFLDDDLFEPSASIGDPEWGGDDDDLFGSFDTCDGPDPAPTTASGRGEQASARQSASTMIRLRRAAEAGDVEAQLALAEMFEGGASTPQDQATARRWTVRAAQSGDPRAMHNLGLYCLEGFGGPGSPDEALFWFRRAAAHGVADSIHNASLLEAAAAV